ncbi:MAG: PstS family phosphate ABC transporter substrate-binding protein [Thermoleophilia bacterium]|nr:PstS family phosphate ABC transporter substrate-binding protein [Thermoleophilia bacterium]
MNRSSMFKISSVICAIGAIALIAAGCGSASKSKSSGLTGSIKIDGSSTVGPLTEAAAENFQNDERGVHVTVGTSGTGGGFEKFCNGETDIADASREIKPEEAAICTKHKIEYQDFAIANDGIALVVNPKNDWADCLTTAQLKKIWDLDSKVKTWKDVDPKFPDEKLSLYGPGTDSGTFDFFTEAINGEKGRSRSDYNATEDDNVTVQGVSGDKGGFGYFGLSYVEQNQDKVKAVKIDSGSGCVEPTSDTVQSNKYSPLSRPLFIYPNTKLLARKEGLAFVEYYLANTDKLTKQALFVPLTGDQKSRLDTQLAALKKA